MKKLCLTGCVFLLLILCACNKKVERTPEEAAPAPVAEVQQTEEISDSHNEEADGQNDSASTAGDTVQEMAVTPELLKNRLENASFCSCLMEQSARWHLAQAGALEEAETDTPFLSALAAFEETMSAHPEDFSDVAEDCLWLLDSGTDGSLILQFLRVGADDAVECRSLVFDPEAAVLQTETTQWDSLHWADCAEAASDAERQRIREKYALLSSTDPQPRFWRVSMANGGTLALTALETDLSQADVMYAAAQTHGELVLNADDITAAKIDEPALACLHMRFDESVVNEDDAMLLRGFLAIHLSEQGPLWDEPVPSCTEFSRFYDVRNALALLLRDLRADDSLKEALLLRKDWTLFWNAGSEYTLTAQGTGDALTAQLYPAGTDVEGLQTPSRKKLEQLAQEGQNSELVPDEQKAQFILAVMRDLQYGRMMSGEFGEAAWVWHETDGEIRLEVDVVMENGEKSCLIAQFVPDASGEPILSVSTHHAA